MQTNYFSQRQFTKLAGISSATLTKMIKEGVVKLEPDGTIAFTELRKLVLRTFQKERVNNSLVFVIGTTDTETDIITQLQTYFGDSKKYYTSVDALISSLINAEPVKLSYDLLETKYTKLMCKEFYSKYSSLMQSYLTSLIIDSTREKGSSYIRDLPVGVIHDLVMYGSTGVVFDLVPYKDLLNMIQDVMNSKFKKLMTDLAFLSKDNKLLFSREDLTPEVMQSSDSFYDFFITKLDITKDNLGCRHYSIPKKVSKYYNPLVERLQVANLRNKTSDIASDGFFTSHLYNIDLIDSSDTDAIFKVYSVLSTTLLTGVFTEILINCTEAQFNEVIPDMLKELIRSYEYNGLKLKFAKEG